MAYLKDKQYYSDLYDRLTVEECRRLEQRGNDRIDVSSTGEKNPKKQKLNKVYVENVITPTILYFVKGERYKEKAGTIREWMERDVAKDQLLASAIAPEGIQCLKCHSLMNPSSKDLHDWGQDNNDRVLFMYDCPNGCLPRRAFFHTGEEWKSKRDICPECSLELKVEMKNTKTVFTTIFTCPQCKYTKTDTMERPSVRQEKEDKNFEKDRARFCLIKEQGQEYLETLSRFEQMKQLVDQLEKEDKNKDVYEKARALQKLTVVQVQNLLMPALKQQGYINLSFKQPELSKEVSMEFAAQDSRGDRQEYDSKSQLKKLIQKTLEDTAWRLMSDGISYRLGILTGRLRAHEKEEDLLKLVTPIVRQKNNAKT